MKITAMAAVAITVAMNAGADEVPVYVKSLPEVPVQVLRPAQSLANEMFAAVGVKIDWRRGEPSRSQSQHQRPIMVELVTGTSRERLPGALAFSLPYEGVHIDVFYDRVQEVAPPASAPNVLAHVLVHEITHILQGANRHSDTGVMKASWNQSDFMEMRFKSLPFTEEDVQLIRIGLDVRSKTVALIAAAPDR
jgi:hypothetical protein